MRSLVLASVLLWLDNIIAQNIDDDVLYILNTRNHLDVTFDYKNTTEVELNPSIPIILIAHGWSETPHENHYITMKDEYLKKYDCNVIRIDWSKITLQKYSLAAFLTRDVGKSVGRTVIKLHEIRSVPYENVRFVSHSLGSHVAGFAGKEVFRLTGSSLRSIIALDPAGPLFSNRGRHHRLAVDDAERVIVLHTDGGFFGTYAAIGTVDLYANTGIGFQPGCTPIAVLYDFDNLFCSHWKSYQLFIDAINNPKYVATRCNSWFYYAGGFCRGNEEILVEEDLTIQAYGVYYFKTD